jgi:CheY-like chemotaxis protein
VAHNFNNLLMSIQGFVSLMFLDVDERHPTFSRLKTIEDLIKRGSDLTTQLLGYARHGRFAVKPVAVDKAIRSATVHLGTKRPEIGFEMVLPDKLWSVAADREQLEHVFKHLFFNAAEAMPEGGTVYLKAENVLLKEHFAAPYGVGPGPYVKIAVTDTGVGMDRDTQERIFEPFFSTKDVSKGAGLGLASVYGTIQSHKGIIQVSSEKEKGSTFTIFLPAITKEADADAPSAFPVSGVSPTILMVDDERVICEVTADIINKMGYRTITTCDGEEALDIFHARQDEVDLVIVDMVMPGLSGEQVVDAMRKMAPDIKVILISGYPESEEVQKAMRDTRQAFLQKPLQPKLLSATIRQLLDI